MQRRTFIGGMAALFAVAAAPVPANILAHDKQAVGRGIEILQEEWLIGGGSYYATFGDLYRAHARCNGVDAFCVCLVVDASNLHLRDLVRADARQQLRLYYKTHHGMVL